jgi:hypothetical protein
MKIQHEDGEGKASGQRLEPRVGIFWLVNDRLLTDTTPLNEAESYGNHLGHPRSHIDVWKRYQQIGKAPLDSEYEEFPRGRVVYDTKTSRFTLLADACILKEKGLVAHIKKEMRLSRNTKVGKDSHYRCFGCLRGRLAE